MGKLHHICGEKNASANEQIFGFLLAPAVEALGEGERTLQAIAPTEIFFTYLKCAVLAGFVFALPVWLSLSAGPFADLLTPTELAEIGRDAASIGVSLILVNCVSASLVAPYVDAIAALAVATEAGIDDDVQIQEDHFAGAAGANGMGILDALHLFDIDIVARFNGFHQRHYPL